MMSNLNVQVYDNASWAIAFELLSPGRKKSVGQFNILQYLDNFLPINFRDNDPANGTLSQCLQTPGVIELLPPPS